MDSTMIWLWVFGAAMIAALVLVSRFQTRAYRNYLTKHAAETEKVTAGQAEILAVTRDQIAVLERIATALENRG